ncbi:TetR/AcrR family transcriptional regulator [Kitasatospora sp. NPDC054939]
MGVKGEETRARLIAGTRALIEAQGYFGTGLNQVLAESGAPRGSLYFHFPAGKDQMVTAALLQAGQEIEELLKSLAGEGLSAAVIARRLMDLFADRLEESQFAKGCPIATVALEVAGSNEELRRVCAGIYENWQQVITDRLIAEGGSPESAEGASGRALAQMQGALLLAQVHRSHTPLEQASRAVQLLLTGN